MSEYRAELAWERHGAVFVDGCYSRRHVLRFDGGLEIPASASPNVVAEPMADPAALDPEEAFVASLASCHMLWFLAIAAERGYRVDSYRDNASGTLSLNDRGRLAMTSVVLRPKVAFGADGAPSAEEVVEMHDAAHTRCFIASSVTTEVRCEPG